MKCAELNVAEQTERTEQTESNQGVINLPMGLLGFEEVKHYVLLGSPEEAPFLWLRMVDDPNLAFLVISPSVVLDPYEPDITDEEVEFLGIANAMDALVFNIVTVHPDGHATVNLKGPIIVNRQTLVGKQIVPKNAASYSLHHPLPVARQ